MKLGKAEGTPEEIKNFFENNGMNPEDYFEKTERPLHWMWLAIPGSIVAVAVLMLVLLDDLSPKTHILIFLVGAGSACWVATSLQVRFKNVWATTVVAVGALLVLLVAAGFITPKETVDAIKGLKGD